jgi:hypothetical protein
MLGPQNALKKVEWFWNTREVLQWFQSFNSFMFSLPL